MKRINLMELNSKVIAYRNCIQSGNKLWEANHLETIEEMCKLLPHGSGIDGKFEIQIENCKDQSLWFILQFHHMDEHGSYTGWTEHNVIITPEFGTFKIKLTGRNVNGCKEYLTEMLYEYFTISF